MMRSMYAGVSGLKVHQTKMDVIGNNISNVNTVGFKSSTVAFSDVLYQTSSKASGPNDTTGTAGINAKQIGLGANLASITASMTTNGGSQRTDGALDIMIEGDGFFIVNNGVSNYFTKAGNFNVDSVGTLCTSSGANVMGWKVDPNDPNKCVADTVSPLRVMGPDNLYVDPVGTTDLYFKGNIDYKDTQLTTETGKNTTMSFYDSLGQSYMALVKVTQTADNLYGYNVSVTDILDCNGDSIFVKKTLNDDGTYSYDSTAITGFSWGGIDVTPEIAEDGTVSLSENNVLLQFDGSTGKFMQVGEEEGSKAVSLVIEQDNANPFKEIKVDFSSMTMYASSGSSSISSERGNVENGYGAGRPAGNMTGISVDVSGKIYGTYDNGDTKLLGQIAVATFANAMGLEAIGNNMFAETMNSGSFDGVGKDITESGGKMNTGVLEMSNVDLATEFTNMITTQRGFQANSRIITTSDTLLEELINLKR